MYDVAIVGSGPAGMTAAHSLSGKGLKVIVIERLSGTYFEKYHRICGGGVSSDAFIERPPEDCILNHIQKISIGFPDGKEIGIPSKGYIIDRPAYLAHLRSHSDTEFVHASVTDIVVEDTITLRTRDRDIVCRYLIGADGAFSVVRKKVFGTRPRECVPITEYITDKEPRKDLFFRIGTEFRGCYEWDFPCGTDSCVGSNIPMETDHIMKGTRYIPSGGVRGIVKGNVLLIGDAAGMPNPVSYGGLRVAFESACKASEAVIRGDTSILQKWWDSSKYSDERFVKLHDHIGKMDREGFDELSKPLVHKSFWLNGFMGCLRHPHNGWIYFGCLFAFRHGW